MQQVSDILENGRSPEEAKYSLGSTANPREQPLQGGGDFAASRNGGVKEACDKEFCDGGTANSILLSSAEHFISENLTIPEAI